MGGKGKGEGMEKREKKGADAVREGRKGKRRKGRSALYSKPFYH